jgi:hypothetical protein
LCKRCCSSKLAVNANLGLRGPNHTAHCPVLGCSPRAPPSSPGSQLCACAETAGTEPSRRGGGCPRPPPWSFPLPWGRVSKPSRRRPAVVVVARGRSPELLRWTCWRGGCGHGRLPPPARPWCGVSTRRCLSRSLVGTARLTPASSPYLPLISAAFLWKWSLSFFIFYKLEH